MNLRGEPVKSHGVDGRRPFFIEFENQRFRSQKGTIRTKFSFPRHIFDKTFLFLIENVMEEGM